MKKREQEMAVLLHDVRSAHNVGSIFRTADAAGASKVWLSGVTPTPRDRFGRVQKEIAKTALGAEGFLEWEYKRSPSTIIARLKKEGWRIVGVEQDVRARDYRALKLRKPTLFIFGNEVRGVPKRVRARCDELIEIPMHGKKESLNVSVVAGIVLFAYQVAGSASRRHA
jgi:23S rRNA (guanosine2251-2'-O)-methyltransferase